MDFILDCVQEMTEPAQSEGENDSIETESLDSISTALERNCGGSS